MPGGGDQCAARARTESGAPRLAILAASTQNNRSHMLQGGRAVAAEPSNKADLAPITPTGWWQVAADGVGSR